MDGTKFRKADLWDANITPAQLLQAGDSEGIHLRGSLEADYQEELRLSAETVEADDREEEARRTEHEAIPEWAQGLYHNEGIFNEVLVYHDDEAIYFEHKGKESGIVRFTFEMIEGLKIVEEEEQRHQRYNTYE
jgi:hypothetical protein